MDFIWVKMRDYLPQKKKGVANLKNKHDSLTDIKASVFRESQTRLG